MSKALSLKLRDDIFAKVESITGRINIPRNTYINLALEYFNKIQSRKFLKKQLRNESNLVRESSMEVLKEFEMIEDDIAE